MYSHKNILLHLDVLEASQMQHVQDCTCLQLPAHLLRSSLHPHPHKQHPHPPTALAKEPGIHFPLYLSPPFQVCL